MLPKVGLLNALNNNDIESNDYLQVNCCGIHENGAKNSIVFRATGRKDYQLILILDGGAVFKNGDKTITLSNNEMIIIPPNVKNEYRYTEHVSAVWIHFTGNEVKRILNSYGIDFFKNYKISSCGSFVFYTEKIIEELQLKKEGFMNNCNAYLLNILTLAKREIKTSFSDNSGIFTTIDRIAENMQVEFAKNKSIEEYAQMCNISASRFAHMFCTRFGTSPHRYLINIRIAQAKALLTDTDKAIFEISKSIGYDDPFYFSRVFKKETGLSPIQYRNRYLKE